MYSTLPQRYIQQRSNDFIQRYIQQLNNKLHLDRFHQQIQTRTQSTSTSTSTSANANKAASEAAKPEQAGRAAGEAVQNAAAGKEELPRSFLPSSDRWTKTIGTLGALANWTIPSAAIAHMMSKPADTVDPKMTVTLAIYSCFFMRWALAISPTNYPLLVCHAINVTAQSTQLVRYFTSTKTSASTSAPAISSVQSSSNDRQPVTTSTQAAQQQSPSAAAGNLTKVLPGDRKG